MMRFSHSRLIEVFTFLCVLYVFCHGQKRDPTQQLIERVDDLKKFRTLLRTKNNVLVLFSKTGDNVPAVKRLLPIFGDVAERMYGKATLAVVNCGTEEGKKLCKKLKVAPEPNVIKHYNNGDFNKDYDRQETADSFVRFLKDPTGELPWEEEAIAKDVLHVQDAQSWMKLLRREKTPILGMFYAPWCTYCKRLKPEYSIAATELKGHAILAGIDVTRSENYQLQQLYNITGFPTLLYFENGNVKFPFGGPNNTKDGIVHWMKNPQPAKENVVEQPADKPWSEEDKSAVVHLTDATFDEFLSKTPSVLVMFYAPWCGHCKKMKGDVMAAANRLKDENVHGAIAAVDATKEKQLGDKYGIKGYPTVKYFKDGKFAWDYHERSEDQLVAFMKNPNEPPPPPVEQPWNEVESDVIHLTGDNFKTELKKRKHAIVMFYAPWCGHCKAAKPDYMKAAARYKDDQKVLFGAVDCTTNTEICQQQEVNGYPAFKYFSYLKTALPYEGMRSEIDFVTFMAQKIDPSAPAPVEKPKAEEPAPEPWDSAVQLLSATTFQSTLEKFDRSIVMYFAPWCGHCKKAKPEFIEAAKSAKPKIGFAAIDCSANAEFCKEKNIQGYPTFHIYAKGTFERAFEGQRSKDSFTSALEQQAQPAGPAQKKEDEDPWDAVVPKLSSETFQSTISKAEKALVMFYAPWCGHCQTAKPEFINAAKEVNKPESRRLLAAIDCTQNTDFCREKGIKGFPTINLYESGNFVKPYSGKRVKDGFIAYLDQTETKEQKKEEL